MMVADVAATTGPSGSAALETVLALACRAFACRAACLTFPDGSSIWSGGGPAPPRHLSAASAAGGRAAELDDPPAAQSTLDAARLHLLGRIPVALHEGEARAALCLLDAVDRRLEPDEASRLRALGEVVAALLARDRPGPAGPAAADLAETRAAAAPDRSAASYKKMYERSSALAKIGVWECDLADETLTWTDGVYDIFELPRGIPVTRDMPLALYFEESRRQMESLRARAIAECSSFSLDVKVRTARGRVRWVRLSADVEAENGVPVRLFGLKQDITQERRLLDRLRQLAEYDPLTGLANRGMFESLFARARASGTPHGRLQLVLLDLDGFKAVNDTFGHAAGDACLRATAKRLRHIVRRPNVIGRLGGDEFALLIAGRSSLRNVAGMVCRIVDEVGLPIRHDGATFRVGVSAGLSSPRACGECDLEDMFAEADRALYEAKAAGRNTHRVFDRQPLRRVAS